MRSATAAGIAGLALLAGAAAAVAQQKHQDDQFKLLRSDKIGGLRIDLTEAQVKQLIPEQPARGRDRHWAADAMYHQQWIYARRGLKLSMVSEKMGGPKTLESIECTARCTLRTARGIGIGSSLDEVQRAYAAEFNRDESKLPGLFVGGTIYGGLIVKLTRGRVSGIFLGAAAE